MDGIRELTSVPHGSDNEHVPPFRDYPLGLLGERTMSLWFVLLLLLATFVLLESCIIPQIRRSLDTPPAPARIRRAALLASVSYLRTASLVAFTSTLVVLIIMIWLTGRHDPFTLEEMEHLVGTLRPVAVSHGSVTAALVSLRSVADPEWDDRICLSPNKVAAELCVPTTPSPRNDASPRGPRVASGNNCHSRKKCKTSAIGYWKPMNS